MYEATSRTNIEAKTKYGLLHHLALEDWLGIARKKWLNKTIYAKNTHLCQYDAVQGKETTVDIPCGKPLVVTDVMWGMNADDPIWIVVKADKGRRGYYQIFEGNSAFNTDVLSLTGMPDADTKFFPVDPTTLRGWGPSVLDNITEHHVTVRMTEEQVVLALGYPKKTNKYTDLEGTVEQWVYPGEFVYLHSGNVTDIQEL